MKQTLIAAALSLACMASPLGHAGPEGLEPAAGKGGPWQVVRNDRLNKVQTFSRQEPGKSYRAFRAEAVLDASLDAAARNQLDVDNLKNWYANAEESALLKKVSPTEFYYYVRVDTPFGTPNRDMVIHAVIEPFTAAKGALVIRYNAAPDFIPARPDVVRIPVYQMVTRLTPMGVDQTREETEGYVDPGNGTPGWLVNLAQKQTPYNNMIGKQRTVRKYRNHQEAFPFKYRE